MIYNQAYKIALAAVEQLRPHCERIEIAGSIRRQKIEVKDIEIVLIPKPYETGLFASGVATVINQWPKVKGGLPCRYTQRILPQGIAADIFFATPDNWGLILAIRTGSAAYSHTVLATGWVKAGYKSIDGMLTRDGLEVTVPEEVDLFDLIGIPMVPPEERSL